ncbi:MAG: hypothetical protein AB9869_19465 [Verrucomicrobiia bacterium]
MKLIRIKLLFSALTVLLLGATHIGASPVLDWNNIAAPVGAKASKQLGSVRNEVASTLLPGTRYDNIVNNGCGWASGDMSLWVSL